jgi:N-glycosylase/DNA lyase
MPLADPTVHFFPVADYDLEATLESGQAFRWVRAQGFWTSVIQGRWVALKQTASGIEALTAEPQSDWLWLEDYLQINLNLNSIMASFPQDAPMATATHACRGLRLLRQDPWECLASFILSSTKQIVQIRQIVALLCEKFGEPLKVLPGHERAFSFPTAEKLARATEAELRICKMGFRAPYLLGTAREIVEGRFSPAALRGLPVEISREKLMALPGVGRKVADCVLLFAYGYQEAFPVDVWVIKALRQLYFPRRNPSLKRLHRFSATHFGPWAGYAQQYLFHYMRTKVGRKTTVKSTPAKPRVRKRNAR